MIKIHKNKRGRGVNAGQGISTEPVHPRTPLRTPTSTDITSQFEVGL